MLSIENLSCAYGNHIIFENINATLGEGALVVLHGPNGCGKTSLLNIVAGLLPPKHGAVKWNGTQVSHAVRDGDLVLNFVGHGTAVKPELSVFENLQFWAKLKGEPEKVFEAMETFGLTRIARKLCGSLSAGWNKRVALARLICCPSEIWVLDEPYNNLDAAVSGVLDKMLADYCKSGGIVVLSSHTIVPVEFANKLNVADYAPKDGSLEAA